MEILAGGFCCKKGRPGTAGHKSDLRGDLLEGGQKEVKDEELRMPEVVPWRKRIISTATE